MATDPPTLDALLLPFTEGELAWPAQGGVLFMHARDGQPLHRQPWPGLHCQTTSRPDFDALQRSGLDVHSPESAPTQLARYPLVLVLPPRQREQARALFARAIGHLAPGGIVVACMANAEGAKSGQADLARLAGPVRSLSKHHCRVFWTAPLRGPIDPPLMDAWATADAPRPIDDGRFLSRPGVFAWDHVDPASALLAAHLPADLAGHGADLGAGYGYLAAEVLSRCRAVTAMDLYEADARALALARANLAASATQAALAFHWHDVTTGLRQAFDFIVSNPPFHAQGRADRPDLGRAFIAAAAEALRPGGRLLLAANRHLPYESVLDAHFGSTRTLVQQAGFKVIEGVKAA